MPSMSAVEPRVGDRGARSLQSQFQTRDAGPATDTRDADTTEDRVLLEVRQARDTVRSIPRVS